MNQVNFLGVSPAFQLRRCTLLAFGLRCSYDNGFSTTLLWRFLPLPLRAPLLGACFEQGQNKRRRVPLLALRGTFATLTPFVSRLYCDPWRFSAIWTNFAIVVEAPASEMGVLISCYAYSLMIPCYAYIP